MTTLAFPSYAGHRFPAEIISHAVWLCCALSAESAQRGWPQSATGVTSATSEGSVAIDGDPMHDPAIAIVVVQGIVLYAAIVPKCDRTRLPAEAACVLRPDRVLEKKSQERAAFLDGHILEAN